jgi:hypothetical protein
MGTMAALFIESRQWTARNTPQANFIRCSPGDQRVRPAAN